LVYLSSEWSGLEPGTELLVSLAVNDDQNNFVDGTPFEWGLSNTPRLHDRGAVMWSFDAIEPGTYDFYSTLVPIRCQTLAEEEAPPRCWRTAR
jgi:hypothetical protein